MQRRAASKVLALLSSRVGAAEAAAAGAAPAAAASAAAAAAAATASERAAAQAAARLCALTAARAFSAQAAPASSAAKSTANVPLGHHDSDLSSVACHIGLGRRRDLTMREDLALWKNGATRISLADVFRVRACTGWLGGWLAGWLVWCCVLSVLRVVCCMCYFKWMCCVHCVCLWRVAPWRTQRSTRRAAALKSSVPRRPSLTQPNAPIPSKSHQTTPHPHRSAQGSKALLVGFPGGKVCTEAHIPGYVAAVPELKAAGVDKVVCVTVGDPEAVQKWAADNGFDRDTVRCCCCCCCTALRRLRKKRETGAGALFSSGC